MHQSEVPMKGDTVETNTAIQWCYLFGIEIIHPAGWNISNSPSMDAEIDYDEMYWRLSMCSVAIVDPYRWEKFQKGYYANSYV
jgi:hypothetical protein